MAIFELTKCSRNVSVLLCVHSLPKDFKMMALMCMNWSASGNETGSIELELHEIRHQVNFTQFAQLLEKRMHRDNAHTHRRRIALPTIIYEWMVATYIEMAENIRMESVCLRIDSQTLCSMHLKCWHTLCLHHSIIPSSWISHCVRCASHCRLYSCNHCQTICSFFLCVIFHLSFFAVVYNLQWVWIGRYANVDWRDAAFELWMKTKMIITRVVRFVVKQITSTIFYWSLLVQLFATLFQCVVHNNAKLVTSHIVKVNEFHENISLI